MPTRRATDSGCDKPNESCDRRSEDAGPPPGWRDRRRFVERRLPVVQENALTESEWFLLLVKYRLKMKSARRVTLDAIPLDVSKER